MVGLPVFVLDFRFPFNLCLWLGLSSAKRTDFLCLRVDCFEERERHLEFRLGLAEESREKLLHLLREEPDLLAERLLLRLEEVFERLIDLRLAYFQMRPSCFSLWSKTSITRASGAKSIGALDLLVL